MRAPPKVRFPGAIGNCWAAIFYSWSRLEPRNSRAFLIPADNKSDKRRNVGDKTPEFCESHGEISHPLLRDQMIRRNDPEIEFPRSQTASRFSQLARPRSLVRVWKRGCGTSLPHRNPEAANCAQVRVPHFGGSDVFGVSSASETNLSQGTLTPAPHDRTNWWHAC